MAKIIIDPTSIKNFKVAQELGNSVTKTISLKVITKELNKILNLTENVKLITYNELFKLKNNSQLIPGCNYQIIDYLTTTELPNTISAEHLFDIIVTADSENVLNENARAVQHKDDKYFNNSNLSAWELKYTLDNDISRFEWAIQNGPESIIVNNTTQYFRNEFEDKIVNNKQYYAYKNDSEIVYLETTDHVDYNNIYYYEKDYFYGWEMLESGYLVTEYRDSNTKGKGIIYYMKDEFGNEASYDFKNILFKIDNEILDSDTFYYTFNYDLNTDYSLLSNCFNNVIKEYIVNGKRILNKNIINCSKQYPLCNNNFFDTGCHDNVLSGTCYENKFGIGCYNNILRGSNRGNVLEEYCINCNIGIGCEYCTIFKNTENQTIANNVSNIMRGYNMITEAYKYATKYTFTDFNAPHLPINFITVIDRSFNNFDFKLINESNSGDYGVIFRTLNNTTTIKFDKRITWEKELEIKNNTMYYIKIKYIKNLELYLGSYQTFNI